MKAAMTVDELDDKAPAVVLLHCGRTLTFQIAPPKTGEEVWCAYHRHYVRVKEGRAEYRARCKDCRFSRPYGVARETAYRKGMQHARRMGHVVNITQGAAVLHVIDHSQQMTLDDAEEPPF